MQITIRDIFEAGKKYGQLYEGMNLDAETYEESQCALGLRIIRRPAGMFEIRSVMGESAAEIKGQWEFNAKEFGCLSQMVRQWRKERFDIGMYTGVNLNRFHHYYVPPGKYSEAVLLPAHKMYSFAREIVNIKIADRWLERSQISGRNAGLVGRVFDWHGHSLFWRRDSIVLVQGTEINVEDEKDVIDYRFDSNPVAPRHFRTYMNIGLVAAKYLNEVGDLLAEEQGAVK